MNISDKPIAASVRWRCAVIIVLSNVVCTFFLNAADERAKLCSVTDIFLREANDLSEKEEETLIRAKAEAFARELLQLSAEDRLEDELLLNGIHSLQYVKLIVMLEAEFDVQVPDAYLSMNALPTFSKLEEFIASLKRGEAPSQRSG